MISIHPEKSNPQTPWQYAAGFKDVNVESVDFIARLITRSVWSGICWQDGRRRNEDFLFSDWCVLDFDEPGFTLAEALQTFSDRIHLIGTTKSHRKEKHGIVCDRFRVAIKWEERITDLRTYRHNMGLMADRYPLDEKALDGARYFFPCEEILQKSGEGFTEEVSAPPEPLDPKIIAQRRKIKRVEYELYGKLPSWVDRFLKRGDTVAKKGTNNTIYAAALELFTLGFSFEEIIEMIEKAPIDRTRHSIDRISRSVRSAERRSQHMQIGAAQ